MTCYIGCMEHVVHGYGIMYCMAVTKQYSKKRINDQFRSDIKFKEYKINGF